MSRLITALAAAAALGLSAPALAQDPMGAMPNGNVPWCSSTVTDHCMQHEGMSGSMMHHGMMTHHRLSKHHRMMHRMLKRHGMMAHHNMRQRNTKAHHRMMHNKLMRHDTMKKM